MKNNKSTGKSLREKREEKGLLLRHISAELDIDLQYLVKLKGANEKRQKNKF